MERLVSRISPLNSSCDPTWDAMTIQRQGDAPGIFMRAPHIGPQLFAREKTELDQKSGHAQIAGSGKADTLRWCRECHWHFTTRHVYQRCHVRLSCTTASASLGAREQYWSI